MMCLVYDVLYERLKIKTYINIAGIFVLFILFCDDVRFVLKSLRNINYIVPDVYCIWQEYGVEMYTLSFVILTYGSLRVRNFLYLFSYS
jgi:hypothetical protein